jgi:hypothetical protein
VAAWPLRQSFELLLEREPASSVLSQFSLDDISRYFPEYERELVRAPRGRAAVIG